MALVDDDHAARQGLDVGHVMAGEQDGRAGFVVVGGDELADALLHGDVQADGGLVQEEHAGPVQQAGRKLDLHALAERKLADGLGEEIAEVQQFSQQVDGALVDGVVDAEHGLVDQEGVDGRQVPEQLLALAHDEGDSGEEVGAAVPGGEAEDVHLAVGGVQQAAHDLERGGFAGAVGAQEADDLAAVDLERDAVDGADEAVFAAEHAAK